MHEADKLRSWLERSQEAISSTAFSTVGILCQELFDGRSGGSVKPHARAILVLVEDIDQDRMPRLPDSELVLQFASLRAAVSRMIDIIDDRPMTA